MGQAPNALDRKKNLGDGIAPRMYMCGEGGFKVLSLDMIKTGTAG